MRTPSASSSIMPLTATLYGITSSPATLYGIMPSTVPLYGIMLPTSTSYDITPSAATSYDIMPSAATPYDITSSPVTYSTVTSSFPRIIIRYILPRNLRVTVAGSSWGGRQGFTESPSQQGRIPNKY